MRVCSVEMAALSFALLAGCSPVVSSPNDKTVGRLYAPAMTYLADLTDQAIIADAAMVNVSNLSDIRDTFQSVMTKENSSYQQYTNLKSSTSSAQDQDIAKQVDAVHVAFQNSLAEMIVGAEDSDPQHIIRGSTAFKRSLESADEVIHKIKQLTGR